MKTSPALMLAFIAIIATTGYSQSTALEESAVRAVIQTFSDSRNAHDGKAAANTYVADGEYIGYNGPRTIGRIALAALWGGVREQVQRTINSVDLISPNIALVHVLAEYQDSTWKEIFLVIKRGGEWQIQIQEAVTPAKHI